jgi:hypothetical protein
MYVRRPKVIKQCSDAFHGVDEPTPDYASLIIRS